MFVFLSPQIVHSQSSAGQCRAGIRGMGPRHLHCRCTKDAGARRRRARPRACCGLLQRVLYLAFREAIGRRHIGIEVSQGRRTLMGFVRVLLCICDQLQERAVLCLKGGKCEFPCSNCQVHVNVAGSPEAMDAEDRVVIYTLENHLEGAGHRTKARKRHRRVSLEAISNGNCHVPAFAGMAGLSTPPGPMYRMIGFDVLHVRYPWPSHSYLACSALYWNAFDAPIPTHLLFLTSLRAFMRLSHGLSCCLVVAGPGSDQDARAQARAHVSQDVPR